MARLIRDPLLGPFTWDDDFGCWCGTLSLPSGRIAEFRIATATSAHHEQPELPEVFAPAYPVARWLRESESEVYGVVARAMVPLYNENWSEEPAISADEFARRIELVEVTVPSDNTYIHLCFTDGEMEMFGGHVIDVYFEADRRLRSATLMG